MSIKGTNYQTPDSVNADLQQVAIIDSVNLPWLFSPQAGVERRLLDRIGNEVARATSLVRYAPDSVFPSHTHGAGEEFLVLEGTFCDEHGNYASGTYVRNPPGSHHAPFTREGCVIFVKLRQMDSGETQRLIIDTHKHNWQAQDMPGYYRKPLFGNDNEQVSIERLNAGTSLVKPVGGGEELLILSGKLADKDHQYGVGTWLRYPAGFTRQLHAVGEAEYWVKRGHLAE